MNHIKITNPRIESSIVERPPSSAAPAVAAKTLAVLGWMDGCLGSDPSTLRQPEDSDSLSLVVAASRRIRRINRRSTHRVRGGRPRVRVKGQQQTVTRTDKKWTREKERGGDGNYVDSVRASLSLSQHVSPDCLGVDVVDQGESLSGHPSPGVDKS